MGILGCSGPWANSPLHSTTQPQEAPSQRAQARSHIYPYPSAATLSAQSAHTHTWLHTCSTVAAASAHFPSGHPQLAQSPCAPGDTYTRPHRPGTGVTLHPSPAQHTEPSPVLGTRHKLPSQHAGIISPSPSSSSALGSDLDGVQPSSPARRTAFFCNGIKALLPDAGTKWKKI